MLSETVANVDFDAFYFAERKSLVRFVMFLGCGDANTAEDIAQTAFAKAFPVWATIRSPRAWLRTVAQNEFIRHCHTAARETSLEAGAERAERAAGVSAAIALEQQAATRELLAALIAALPPKQRHAMAWHWDGFSDEEIADELGDSAVAVRKNRSRAMKKLRRFLADARRDAA